VQVLLDTHIIYWSFYERSRLPALALKLYTEADAVYVSSASVWEIAVKVGLGKLKADPGELIANLESGGFYELPVTSKHAAHVANLPLHHTDPFDRLLIAQAMTESMYLITVDRKMARYSDLVILVQPAPASEMRGPIPNR
jgi:PIN domain nuclease of toxin-antitoxin system